MAVLALEGFDAIDTGTSALSKSPFWQLDTSFAEGKTTGLSASGSCMTVGNNAFFAKCVPGGNYTTLTVGFRFEYTGSGALALQDIMRFYDGTNIQCGLGLQVTTNKLIFWRGTNATVKGTGSTTINLGSIYYIEVKATFSTSSSNTDGTFEVRLNGVAEIGPTSSVNITTTANAYATGIALGRGINAGSNTACYDDFYVLDSTGSVNNTFLSSATQAVRIETLFPTSNNSVVFTPATSTNVSQIQETGMDSDSTYNKSSASGDIDTFNHGSLSSTPTVIAAIKLVAAVRKDDVTNQTIRTKLISNATTSNGTSIAIQTQYFNVEDIYETDPGNSSVPWIASTVNSTKIGYEHV